MTQLSDVVKTFPQSPMELKFDLPFQNHPANGALHIYSSTLPQGVLVLSSTHSPVISEDILKNKGAFTKNFESYLVKHLFYSPEVFQQHQKSNLSMSLVHGHPSLNFHYGYHERGIPKVINGVALMKGGILYHLFYITSEGLVDSELEGHFNHAKQQFIKML